MRPLERTKIVQYSHLTSVTILTRWVRMRKLSVPSCLCCCSTSTWSFDLRECDVVFVPLQALDGVSLPPQVALQLGTKLVWHAAAWSLHGPAKDETFIRL